MTAYLEDEIRDEAIEELKRADHLIYITLKYTKTCDVIKNTIQRLINAFDFSFLAALEHAKKKKKIKSIPTTIKERVDKVRELFDSSDQINEFLDLYNLLKRIDKASYDGICEYRKGLTLIARDAEKDIEVNIETLKSYFEKTKEFNEFTKKWIEGE